ncbi:MAG: sensor histidine kinase N-terminal domain-containing protein [Polaromonas sp.]|nr:sensor histidine kinase N-terminal domain-containing protein [Polaromonas sp.]
MVEDKVKNTKPGAAGAKPSQARPSLPVSSHSLKGRLLWFVLVAILLAAVLQAISAYRGALQQADAMFDDHLQQVARSMRSGAPLGMPLEGGVDDTGFDLYVQIWGQDGTQLFRSNRSALPPRAVLGFSDVEANGSRYRVYSLQTPLQTVQIAQDLSARAVRAQTLALKALLPFALLTPLLMLAVWWVINRSLAPIERARRQLASRAADDFSALANKDLPDEVRPLVDELNLLFVRVRTAFDAQKNFVADAAHELRSPLTALKLQAQALRRADEEPGAREASVARLNLGIDRAIRLVEQLLTLAREEAGTSATLATSAPVDLQEILKLAVADVLQLAALKRIDLGLVDNQDLRAISINGDKESLRMMLRNLLDNAVKYTPELGQIDISLQTQEGECSLAIEDSGPGIEPQDQARVFDRFYRASDMALAPGSGLGLAIVKIIADRHGATLQLSRGTRLGGLRVQVDIPLAVAMQSAQTGS